jgi:hypothetical protein
LTTKGINLKTIWSVGARQAINLLKTYGFSDEELDLSSFDEITTLKPFGENLKDDIIHEDIDDGASIDDTEQIKDAEPIDHEESLDDNLPSVVPEKHDIYVEIDNKLVHKSEAINAIINKVRTSRDRIFRVRGSNQNQIKSKLVLEDDESSDDLLRVTDTVASIAKLDCDSISVVFLLVNKIKSK